jgi:hypothetical protein
MLAFHHDGKPRRLRREARGAPGAGQIMVPRRRANGAPARRLARGAAHGGPGPRVHPHGQRIYRRLRHRMLRRIWTSFDSGSQASDEILLDGGGLLTAVSDHSLKCSWR